MKLIDADAFESVLDFADSDVCQEFPDGYCEFGFSREKIRELLRDIPTVDAVPVVRCRECKHFRHYGKTSLFINGKNIKAGWCQRRISYDEEYRMTADDFCSYGERKEGAG